MGKSIHTIAEGFWNIRGVYRIFGLLNVGTQCSLVRLQSGGYALLDCYTLQGDARELVMEKAKGGEKLEAVINLHPFHTMHVEAVAKMFPAARWYGTSRHVARFPEVKWEPQLTESAEFAECFADDFDLLVPAGVEFVPKDERLHFASVLAIHRATEIMHVDDTLNFLPAPFGGKLSLHPTLKSVLSRREGAVNEFRTWAAQLVERCESVRGVCTAHARLAGLTDEPAGAIAAQVRAAVEKVEPILAAHEQRFG